MYVGSQLEDREFCLYLKLFSIIVLLVKLFRRQTKGATVVSIAKIIWQPIIVLLVNAYRLQTKDDRVF